MATCLPYLVIAPCRDDLLLDWVTTVTDLSLHLQHNSLRELRERTLDHLPPSLRELVRGEKATAAQPTLRSRKCATYPLC